MLLEYADAGQSSEVEQQIAEMAMNASGIHDIARALKISPTTVLSKVKKNQSSSK